MTVMADCEGSREAVLEETNSSWSRRAVLARLAGMGLGGLAWGCGPSVSEASHRFGDRVASARRGPLRITATTGLVADLASRVAGPKVEVIRLMGSGVDPHLYKASIRDVARLNRADAIFYNGLHLEGKLGQALRALTGHKWVRAVTERLSSSQLLKLEGSATTNHARYDPHVWFDPFAWAQGAFVVADTLSELDPNHAAEYRERARITQAEFLDLESECQAILAAVPRNRRVLVTAHDAFGYFGRAFAFEVKAIQGMSTETEASIRQVNALVNFLVARQIPAVFIESTLANRNVVALVEGCRARGHRLAIGGELFSDAMGPDGTPEATYPGMMRANARTIAEALA